LWGEATKQFRINFAALNKVGAASSLKVGRGRYEFRNDDLILSDRKMI
jgi:hypothetical protein